MLEHLDRHDQVELLASEGQALEIRAHELRLEARDRRRLACRSEHALRDVHADDARREWTELGQRGEIATVPAAGVEIRVHREEALNRRRQHVEPPVECPIGRDRLGVLCFAPPLIDVPERVG